MSRTITYIDAITEALDQEMERDDRVFIMGEDIGPSGGVFKATAGLWEKYGEDRVLDTPLAENNIIASALGAAMVGLRPVPEIQFADFITYGQDERNPFHIWRHGCGPQRPEESTEWETVNQ